MTDESQPGDWWEGIATAPTNRCRVLLAFGPVMRPRREGEKKQKRIPIKGKLVDNPDDLIVRDPSISIGMFVDGAWKPGRRSKVDFFDPPTHWMHLPELPDEYCIPKG